MVPQKIRKDDIGEGGEGEKELAQEEGEERVYLMKEDNYADHIVSSLR